jgi:hypothetical protein
MNPAITMAAQEPYYQRERRRVHDGTTIRSRSSGTFPRTVEVLIDYPGNDFSVHAKMTKAPLGKARVEATATEWIDGTETRTGRLEETRIRLSKIESLSILMGSRFMDAVQTTSPPGSKMTSGEVKLAVLNAVTTLKEEYLE